ncbi:phosphoribosylanthranilate isomerase, partial [Staphylococcus xylosus]
MKLKFCGFRQLADVKKAKDLDIDAMGFIHFPKSKRFVDIQTIRQFTEVIPDDKEKVVILVNPDYDVVDNLIEETGITSIQLHGKEPLATISYIRQKSKDIKIIKALPAKDSESLLTAIEYYKHVIDQFIIDTPSQNYGGTGKVYDWEILEVINDIDYLIAGGINHENIKKIEKLS